MVMITKDMVSWLPSTGKGGQFEVHQRLIEMTCSIDLPSKRLKARVIRVAVRIQASDDELKF